MGELVFRVDDLSGEPTRALVRRHLAGMVDSSPMESIHAFDIDRLREPAITFWSGWAEVDGVQQIVSIGALARLDEVSGELKSMRVADEWLGTGAGRAMLRHIVDHAIEVGLTTLWLETGSTPAFEPAHRLYESEGFAFCGPFGSYIDDPFSRYMTRTL